MGPEGIKVDLQMIHIFNAMTITRPNRKCSKILLSLDEKIALGNSKRWREVFRPHEDIATIVHQDLKQVTADE